MWVSLVCFSFGSPDTLLQGDFFFFQAEDGIRDYKVTGVQTCALPISYAVFCLKKKKKQIIHNNDLKRKQTKILLEQSLSKYISYTATILCINLTDSASCNMMS